METAIFGGGCFWCMEALFLRVKGVTAVASGYAGGTTRNPTYEKVCSGTTGHAEVIKVDFDPKIITFQALLEIFFSMHDPTTLNRQGADIGSQYRSIVFYTTLEQKKVYESVKNELVAKKIHNEPIVTECKPFVEFYPAEKYHQDYYAKNSAAGCCKAVINPKLAKLRKKFNKLLVS